MVSGLLTASLLPACSPGLDRIDRRVDELVLLRARDLGDDTPAPSREHGQTEKAPESATRAPETANPDADELLFEPADEAHDVTERLRTYAEAHEARGARELDLEGALEVALTSSRELRSAEEDYILSAISLLLARREFSPRLFNTTDLSLSGQGDDGRVDSTLRIMNELGVTRNLRSGGRVAASWVASLTEDLRSAASDRTSNASSLVLSGDIPLLRGFGRVAREGEIQAERDVVYAARTFERFRRSLLVDIATDYFNLLQSQASIANQVRQLRSFEALERQTAARVDAGRLEEFELSIAANQVLSARAQLASLRENYTLALDRFKVRLGLPLEAPVRVLPVVFDVPAPGATVDDATRWALDYRLDLQTTRDRMGDARRGVDVARNELRPDLDLRGSVTVPTDTDERQGNLGPDPEDLSYEAGIRLSLPLDRDDERLRLRRAQIDLERSRRSYTLARDNVVLGARASVRSIDLARFQLELAERQVVVNKRRVLGQQLNIDEIEPQTLVDTQNELLNAENARDQALTNLRVAVLNYLLTTGQMRVDQEGRFDPLSGLVIRRSGPSEGPALPDAPGG